MQRATNILIGYGASCAMVLAYATDCGAKVDDQSDAGSSIHYISGTKNTEVKAGSTAEGTYRTSAPANSREAARCRWRVYKPVNGVWRQSSPATKDEWNTLGWDHKGKVKLKGHVLFQSRECPRWEARK